MKLCKPEDEYCRKQDVWWDVIAEKRKDFEEVDEMEGWLVDRPSRQDICVWTAK